MKFSDLSLPVLDFKGSSAIMSKKNILFAFLH